MAVITLNGESRVFEEGLTVADLLLLLELEREQVAVALNRVVVPKSRHPSTILNESDEVEIVHVMGGG